MEEDLRIVSGYKREREGLKSAKCIMSEFEEKTGCVDDDDKENIQNHGYRPSLPKNNHRVLVVDSVAMNNYVLLSAKDGTNLADEKSSKSKKWIGKAYGLVDKVHCTLGKCRVSIEDENMHHEGCKYDNSNTGWLSDDMQIGITKNGLRIGNPLPERRSDLDTTPDINDTTQENLRDGQVYHILMKWIYSLALLANSTDDSEKKQQYLNDAFQLVVGTHSKFVRDGTVYWKLSTDLSRVLVSSTSKFDVLEGWLTLRFLKLALKNSPRPLSLDNQIAELQTILLGQDFLSSDCASIGLVLSSCYRLSYVISREKYEATEALITDLSFFEHLIRAATIGTRNIATMDIFNTDPLYRNALSELYFVSGLIQANQLESNLFILYPRMQKILGPMGVSRRKKLERGIMKLQEDMANINIWDGLECWLDDTTEQRCKSWISDEALCNVVLASCLLSQYN